MEFIKTNKDIFDYSKTLESLMPEIGPEARNTLFNQIMRYQDTHDSLVQEYGQITRRVQRAMDTLKQGNAVTSMDLVNGNADRITELVYTLKSLAESLTAMQHALGVKIDWTDFIVFD
jgi:hypothetical protein